MTSKKAEDSFAIEIDLDTTQGEWFRFFGSRIDENTGAVIYEDPIGDARVQVRSMSPFFEEQAKKRKQEVEHIQNPKTRQMERITYFKELSAAEVEKERDDAWDYAITGLENFKNKKTGEIIQCTRTNKIALMKNPVFNRFVARCLQILDSSSVQAREELGKNLQPG